MTRALKEVVKIGFGKFKLNRIFAFVFVDNKGSQRVLEKAGFKFEGRLRKNLIKDKRSIDTLIYSKIK